MRMHKCSECKKNFRHKANRDIHLDGCGPSEQSMDAAADVAGKLLVTDILKLTDEQQQAVEQFKIAFTGINRFSLSIYHDDISNLIGKEWLHDTLINFYLKLIEERSNDTNHRVCVFPTFFYDCLLQGQTELALPADLNIFAYDMVILPINGGRRAIHWRIATIDNASHAIKLYNPLGRKDNVLLKKLEEFLKLTAAQRGQPEHVYEKVNEAGPCQRNRYDCGVFCLVYADFVSRRKVPQFIQKDMPALRDRLIYEICTGTLLNSIQ